MFQAMVWPDRSCQLYAAEGTHRVDTFCRLAAGGPWAVALLALKHCLGQQAKMACPVATSSADTTGHVLLIASLKAWSSPA